PPRRSSRPPVSVPVHTTICTTSLRHLPPRSAHAIGVPDQPPQPPSAIGVLDGIRDQPFATQLARDRASRPTPAIGSGPRNREGPRLDSLWGSSARLVRHCWSQRTPVVHSRVT